MYQMKLSDGYEVQVIGDLCRVIDRNGNQRFAGNHDQVAHYAASRGLRGFGPAPEVTGVTGERK